MSTADPCVARAFACALVAVASSAAPAQSIRFSGQPFYNGSTVAGLVNEATQESVTFVPFDPMPPWNALAAGGQTGGGFVDEGKTVGEAGVQIAGRIAGRASSTLTIDINARAWYEPGYSGKGNSVLVGDSPGSGTSFNNFTIEGGGPMKYIIDVTGDVTPDKVRIFDAATDAPVVDDVILPGTYYFTVGSISVNLLPGDHAEFYQGTWSLTVPAPGAFALLALAAPLAFRRRR